MGLQELALRESNREKMTMGPVAVRNSHLLNVKPMSPSSKEALSGVGQDSFAVVKTPKLPVEFSEGRKQEN